MSRKCDHLGFGLLLGLTPVLLAAPLLNQMPGKGWWMVGLLAFVGFSVFTGDRMAHAFLCGPEPRTTEDERGTA